MTPIYYLFMQTEHVKLDNIKEVFRSRGMRFTPQRGAILSELIATREHPTASALHLKLRKRYPHLSLDTVNRNLIDFCRRGIVQSVESVDKTKRFDACLLPHHHCQCVDCGFILDFDTPALEELSLPRLLTDKFQLMYQRLHVVGVCHHCLAKRVHKPMFI